MFGKRDILSAANHQMINDSDVHELATFYDALSHFFVSFARFRLTTTSSGPTHPSTTTAKDHGRKLQGG
jgi:hypothetical protein